MNFWVKPSKPILSKNLILAGFGDGGKLKSMRYWVIANDELEFWDGTKDSIKTGLKLESHQWQMLTAIHANGVLKLYRNGTEVASRSVVFNNAKNRIKIAPRPQKNEGKFSGNVANFKIWDNALTIAHIQSLFKTAENLDALPFSKGAPETWNSDGTSNRNETELQNPETLPKSISGPQKPSLADVPTAKHLLLNKERGGVLEIDRGKQNKTGRCTAFNAGGFYCRMAARDGSRNGVDHDGESRDLSASLHRFK
jgi:hypothetical protein